MLQCFNALMLAAINNVLVIVDQIIINWRENSEPNH